MGQLIPAGTGFEWYRHLRIPPDSLPPKLRSSEVRPPLPLMPQPTEDDLDREIEYAIKTKSM